RSGGRLTSKGRGGQGAPARPGAPTWWPRRRTVGEPSATQVEGDRAGDAADDDRLISQQEARGVLGDLEADEPPRGLSHLEPPRRERWSTARRGRAVGFSRGVEERREQPVDGDGLVPEPGQLEVHADLAVARARREVGLHLTVLHRHHAHAVVLRVHPGTERRALRRWCEGIFGTIGIERRGHRRVVRFGGSFLGAATVAGAAAESERERAREEGSGEQPRGAAAGW